MRQLPRLSILAAAAALALAAGTPWAGADTQTRTFRHGFPQGSGPVRFANLAGRVELMPGQSDQVVVNVTVHADAGSAGETKRLLEEMKWVRGRDKEGREEWALSYPVDRYKGYHYPRESRGGSELPGFLSFLENGYTSTTYRGERVRIYGQRRSSAPTLYADLKIALPAGSNVVMRNAVGQVDGNGALQGKLVVKTGSGNVRLAAYNGQLTVDTGSGDVRVGSVRGETSIDTGSGDVVVSKLIGNGLVDTGSGDVVVENVSAGRLSIDTGSGDVTVKQGIASKLLAETGSGEVRVVGVDIEELEADTGSGDVYIQSSLDKARRVVADTGSGDIHIIAGANASFDVESSQGSGDLKVGYGDAELRKSGKKVVGARRGSGQTQIRVDTGSGECVISPRGTS